MLLFFYLFFFTDTATTQIYTLSLHDALPILTIDGLAGSSGTITLAATGNGNSLALANVVTSKAGDITLRGGDDVSFTAAGDRKSTRLNSSHITISYAVFCLKKKKNEDTTICE